jgi:hypothetical protein
VWDWAAVLACAFASMLSQEKIKSQTRIRRSVGPPPNGAPTKGTVAPACLLTASFGNARRLHHGCLYTIAVPEVAALAHLPIALASYAAVWPTSLLRGSGSADADKPWRKHGR